jgi:hypothetical protein
MEFRPVSVDEVDVAYRLYVEAFEWLKRKGVRQWLRALPREEFTERQARGELFALFVAGKMAAMVTLAFEQDGDWQKYLPAGKRWWLKTLTVARTHGGRAVGEEVLRRAEAQLAAAGTQEVYLECVDAGFLPDYYAHLGYEIRQRAEITYPSGNTFLVCLMRKGL